MFFIENNAANIQSTDYWDSEAGAAGYCFLSWNGGAGRLLLADALIRHLPEMSSAHTCIVSYGPVPSHNGIMAWELLFEDDSLTPFAITISAEQCDRLLTDESQGGGFAISVWTRAGLQLSLPGKFRKVPSLPCLEAWREV